LGLCLYHHLQIRIKSSKLEEEYDNVRDELSFARNKVTSIKEQIDTNNNYIQKAKEYLESHAPTEALKLAFKKSVKSKAYKDKYIKDLEEFKKRKGIFIKAKQDKILGLENTMKEQKVRLTQAKEDFEAMDKTIKDFEESHYDKDGNIITPYDKKQC